MKQPLVLFLFMLFSVAISAQEVDTVPLQDDIFSAIQQEVPGQGDIDIYQKPGVHLLVDTHSRLNEKNGIDGYRIQIYAGAGNDARDKAYEILNQFLEKFPEFDPGTTYIVYQVPYFKLRIGDFRNKNEAFEFYHQVRKYFPNSYMVKSKINFPKLQQNNDLSVKQ